MRTKLESSQPWQSENIVNAARQRYLCRVVVPDRAGVQCAHAAAAVDGSTAGYPRVKLSLQRSLRESRIFSTFPLKPRGSVKRAYGNRG